MSQEVLDELRRQLAEATRRAEEKEKRIGELETQLSTLQHKYDLATAQLNTRPYIEVLQRKLMPAWLLNGDYPSIVKWAVALEFSLTSTAKVIRGRLDKMSINITIDVLANALSAMYDAYSETISHNKKPRPIKISENDWALLFDEAGLHDGQEQAVIKEVLRPIEYNEYEKKGTQSAPSGYLLYVKNLRINPTDDGTLETISKIKMYCSPFGSKIDHVYFPTNSRKEYLKDVFLRVHNLNEQEIESLKKKLEAVPVDATKKVVTRTNKIFN